jgi:hypothetical protein
VHATVFGRRDGRVTSRRTASLHGGPVDGEQKDSTAGGNPAPAIDSTTIGANDQDFVVRHNTNPLLKTGPWHVAVSMQ